MELKSLIKYIVIIIIILLAVFLSQDVVSRGVVKPIVSDATSQASAYLAKGANWLTSSVFQKIGGEVKGGGETKKIPENISQSVGNKIGNYFSNLGNSIIGKENNNCKTTAP